MGSSISLSHSNQKKIALGNYIQHDEHWYEWDNTWEYH